MYLSERIQFHPPITAPLCLQILSQMKKKDSHTWCSGFQLFIDITFFPEKIFELNTYFVYLNYKSCNVIQIAIWIKCDSCVSESCIYERFAQRNFDTVPFEV